MKRYVMIPVCAMLILLLFTACAEEGSVQEGTAILRFSSFAGGGYEYTVEVDDPSVVRWSAAYEYEEHADEIDGASFDFVVIFTGTKPGSTTASVHGRSPILDNEDSVYTVEVDEELHVVLTPVRKISTFYVYRCGEIAYDTYRINMNGDGYSVSVNDTREQPFSTEDADALLQVIEAYDIASWDGFSESRKYVLDGESFWLEIGLTDGTSVLARGDNAFPAHYFDAIGEIWDILTR